MQRAMSCTALALSVLLSLACAAGGAEPEALRPASELQRHCLDWPGAAISRDNYTQLVVGVEAGDGAIDFTLRDPAGDEVRLGELLRDKPVLLVSGSYTCPVYQENEDKVERLASHFAEDLTTVVVYTMEAHPKSERSIYHGRPKPKQFSDREHPTTWSERAASARDLELGPDVTVLVDDLDGDDSNPFWCTYGRCPNCAWLIDQDGTVAAHHLWFEARTMKRSIETLLQSTPR